MATNTLLPLVEGPHDLEFCARLLKPMGFHRIQQYEALREQHPFWLPLVPERWPQRGDLLARHPVPVFFTNPNGQSVAIINAVGLSKLATRLGIDLAVLPALPDSIGIVLDADDVGTPQDRHAELLKVIVARPEPEAAQLKFPEEPRLVLDGPQRCGVFVMPDNACFYRKQQGFPPWFGQSGQNPAKAIFNEESSLLHQRKFSHTPRFFKYLPTYHENLHHSRPHRQRAHGPARVPARLCLESRASARPRCRTHSCGPTSTSTRH